MARNRKNKMVRKRYLEFVNAKTGEIGQRVDVTGHGERVIERCTRGMLINIGQDWFVRDTADEQEPSIEIKEKTT